MTDLLLYLLFAYMAYCCWRRAQRNRVKKAMNMMLREYMMTVIAEHPDYTERANKLIAAEAKAQMGIVSRVRLLIRKRKEAQKL